MSLIHFDGFETYASTTAVTAVWGGGAPFSFITGRTGLGIVGPGGSGSFFTIPGASEHATLIVGAAIKLGVDVAIDAIRFLSDSAATEHVVVRRVVGGAVAIDRGSTQLAISSAGAWTAGGWTYVEMKATLDDTSGSIAVRLNGSTSDLLTFSGDTKNGGTKTVFDTANIVGYYEGTHGGYDDIYILNGAGASYNNFLGEVRCWPLSPNGNGNSSQGVGSDGNSTDNYLLVDEAATSLNTADYVAITTDGNKDTYAYPSLTPTTGTVIGVKVMSQISKSDAGTKSMRPVVRSGGVDYGGTDVVLSTSFVRSTENFLTNPDTSAAWTISDVNGAEFGFEARP